MREILFRGKRKDNGEWIEGGYAEHDGKSFVVIWTRYSPDTRDLDMVEYYEINPHYTFCLIEVVPETVCQYTGLTDRNGRKIFEGDIIKKQKETFAVFWSESNYEFGIKNSIESFGIAYVYHGDLEVAGNIFDDPELCE